MKKILQLFVCVLGAVLLIAAFFPAAAHADAGGYVITDYDVKAVISESNVYDITETITVDFSEERHGIYRTIPLNRELTRTGSDGKMYSTKVKTGLSGVSVKGVSFAVDYYPDEVEIRIGDAGRTVSGRQTYQIRYQLAFGDDGVDTFDEAYYNILGAEWATTIGRLTFSVTLPKPFDPRLLGFSAGLQGQTGYDPDILKYNVNGNTITGEITKPLTGNAGVTMRAELPQGYFKIPDVRTPEWTLMGVFGLLTLIAVLLFLIFGRNRRPVRTVEFEPPEGMSPPELAYAYRGGVSGRDVASLLVYWAGKGYLKITQKGKTFILEKLNNLYEGAEYEKHMFNILFCFGTAVDIQSLKYTLGFSVRSVQDGIKTAYGRENTRLFSGSNKVITGILYALSGLPVWLMLSQALALLQLGPGFSIPMGLTMSLPFYTAYIFIFMLLKRWYNMRSARRILCLVILLVITAGLFAAFLLFYLPGASDPLFPVSVITSTAIIMLCSASICKRTPRGVGLLGRILGFRDFIVHAEEERLKQLAETDPQYFYHILPYAYVLNVSDQWIKNFARIAVDPPAWYTGEDLCFNAELFTASFQNTVSDISGRAASSSHSSGGSGGSGFSGGSSSGGGGGGGGGGSW